MEIKIKKIKLMMILVICLVSSISFGQDKVNTLIDSSLQVQINSLKNNLSTNVKSQNFKYMHLGVVLVESNLTKLFDSGEDFSAEFSGYPIVIPTLKVSSSIVNTSLVSVISDNFNLIKISPSSTSTHIFIDNGDYKSMTGYSIKIICNDGKIMFEELIKQQKFYIDISLCGSLGVYYVSIINNTDVATNAHKILSY
jgi:hypothetical protein